MIGTFASPARFAAAHSLADWLLGCLGVLSAAGSAGFAVYMVAVGPAARTIPPGGGDFPVFGAFDRRPLRRADGPLHAPAPGPGRIAGSRPAEVDFTPTGSIAPTPPPAASAPGPASGGAEPGAAARVLGGYALHDVFDGKAVVEVHNKLAIVEPGSTIEGAGPVLAIRRQGNRWVVETPMGLIAD